MPNFFHCMLTVDYTVQRIIHHVIPMPNSRLKNHEQTAQLFHSSQEQLAVHIHRNRNGTRILERPSRTPLPLRYSHTSTESHDNISPISYWFAPLRNWANYRTTCCLAHQHTGFHVFHPEHPSSVLFEYR